MSNPDGINRRSKVCDECDACKSVVQSMSTLNQSLSRDNHLKHECNHQVEIRVSEIREGPAYGGFRIAVALSPQSLLELELNHSRATQLKSISRILQYRQGDRGL